MDEDINREGSAEEAKKPNPRDAQGFKENPAPQGLKTPPPAEPRERRPLRAVAASTAVVGAAVLATAGLLLPGTASGLAPTGGGGPRHPPASRRWPAGAPESPRPRP